MTWARFEDRFPWHRKVRGLSDAAFRLHVSAVCWCNEHLTNGHVPAEDLPLASDVRRPTQAVAELVRRGLWDTTDDGWCIHDFLSYNESKATITARREADAERKRRGRDGRTPGPRPGGVRPDAALDSTSESTRESVRPVPARPEPTRSRSVVGLEEDVDVDVADLHVNVIQDSPDPAETAAAQAVIDRAVAAWGLEQPAVGQ